MLSFSPTSSRVWLKQCSSLPAPPHPFPLGVTGQHAAKSRVQAASRLPYQREFIYIDSEKDKSPRWGPFHKHGDGLSLELKRCRWVAVSEKQWHKRISRCGQILLAKKWDMNVIWALDIHAKNFTSTDNETFWRQEWAVDLDNKWVSSPPMGHNTVLALVLVYLSSGSSLGPILQ